jgi:predicted amidophosphoribosyltransferase
LLCAACLSQLGSGRTTRTAGGVMVWAALLHSGPARLLVHRLKYDGLVAAADVLAAAMIDIVPQSAAALVPVPRAMVRRWVHGVDPARALAHALGRRCALPVVDALRGAAWWPRHAGRGTRSRSAARFHAICEPHPSWVLIDDVLTTGATIDAAAAALGSVVRMAIAATSPGRVAGWDCRIDLEERPMA